LRKKSGGVWHVAEIIAEDLEDRETGLSKPLQEMSPNHSKSCNMKPLKINTAQSERFWKKRLKRRSAIEPQIGHMKSDGKLRRNYLKGTVGNAMNAILCAIGHNMRMILRRIKSLFVLIWTCLLRGIKIERNLDTIKSAC
jgi:hypothetical protein